MNVTQGQPIEEAYRYCPRCGHPADRTGVVPFVCGACGFHHFFTPVTAVGALITDSERRLLFIERAKDPGKGLLGLPGGFVDIGETAEQAVVREVQEEVGLQATRHEFLATFPNLYHYRGVVIHVLDLYFVCQVESLEELDLEHQEVRAYRFAQPSSEIYQQMAFESNRRAVQLFDRAR